MFLHRITVRKPALCALAILLLLAGCGQPKDAIEDDFMAPSYDETLAPSEAPVELDAGGDSSQNNGDYIELLSVSPSVNVSVGVDVTLIVEVAYTLDSADAGYLQIGFNSGDDPGVYDFLPQTQAVSSGAGTHIFTADITAKHWDAPDSFSVFVGLTQEESAAGAMLASDWMSIENLTAAPPAEDAGESQGS